MCREPDPLYYRESSLAVVDAGMFSPLDFRPTLLWDGSSEVTDFLLFSQNEAPTLKPEMKRHNCVTTA